jgi:hypothetical protein
MPVVTVASWRGKRSFRYMSVLQNLVMIGVMAISECAMEASREMFVAQENQSLVFFLISCFRKSDFGQDMRSDMGK